MDSIIAALVSFLLIDPLKAETADKLAAARAPQTVVAEMSACTRSAALRIVERASTDPWWAVSNSVHVWVGTKAPKTLLVEVQPSCAGAVAAARPILTQRAA
ncbi:hypothetical protein [Methylobacterium oryzisoli]|uniref:hypothetical protein n=1 Tax=Methylobacterium oryzisoli TaxID=3385502 RepID=UPI0038929350